MRLFEIASADEQMALLKLIMDKTWEALAIQQRQQAQQKTAAKPRQAKPRTPKVPYALPPKPRAASMAAPQSVAQTPKPVPPSPKASFDSKTGFSPQKLTNKKITGDDEEGYS